MIILTMTAMTLITTTTNSQMRAQNETHGIFCLTCVLQIKIFVSLISLKILFYLTQTKYIMVLSRGPLCYVIHSLQVK